MTIFKTARMKLTAWYLLIITIIVITFSSTIYRLVNFEIARISRTQKIKVERWRGMLPPDTNPPPNIFLDEEEVLALQQRLLVIIMTTDLAIIVIAGGMSYILAGKTLSPIEEMVKEQDRFVADSSHELRTPITSLRTTMEVGLRDHSLTKEGAKKLVSTSLNEVLRLQNLTESLLELTRSGSDLELESVKINEFLVDVLKEVEQIANKKKISIKINKINGSVIANKISLTRVLLIVLDNAIKYSKVDSDVVIKTIRNNTITTISVADNGKGIAKENQHKVFDRFFREDSARNSKVFGYGLGLSIAKELMIAQGGRIYVNENRKVGTEVYIELPSSA